MNKWAVHQNCVNLACMWPKVNIAKSILRKLNVGYNLLRIDEEGQLLLEAEETNKISLSLANLLYRCCLGCKTISFLLFLNWFVDP